MRNNAPAAARAASVHGACSAPVARDRPGEPAPRPPVRLLHGPAGSASDDTLPHRSDLFFAAMESTPMPMLVTDPRRDDNPIVFVNKAFLDLTGYADHDVIGHNCRFLQGPQSDRAVVGELREAIAAVREITVEILNYRKDGTTFWNALFISPLFDAAGELVFFFASQLDVTRRRDAERALAQAYRLGALGQLTGGIAHDFNNLLQVVTSHMDALTHRLRREHDDADPSLRSVDKARSAIEKASTLTQQLLAFARRQRFDGRPVDLNALTAGVVDLAGPALGTHVTVTKSFGSAVPHCRVDAVQYESALLNLLVNARDAMPRGGEVRVVTSRVTVRDDDPGRPDGLCAGDYGCVSIGDTGTGIAPDVLPRVTEPFFTTKGEGHGTGLGLSMVLGFVRQAGGTLQIDSGVDHGTTVRLYVPAVADDEAGGPLPAAHLSTVRGGTEFVLIVDDRVDVAEGAHEMLHSLGYRTHVETSATRALEWLRGCDPAGLPALLFCDVIMPGDLNGYLLAREAQALSPGTRVLMTTGYTPEHDDGDGDFALLVKPYRLQDLAVKVRLVLDGAGARPREPDGRGIDVDAAPQP